MVAVAGWGYMSGHQARVEVINVLQEEPHVGAQSIQIVILGSST